jgi:hypothetical protein
MKNKLKKYSKHHVYNSLAWKKVERMERQGYCSKKNGGNFISNIKM